MLWVCRLGALHLWANDTLISKPFCSVCAGHLPEPNRLCIMISLQRDLRVCEERKFQLQRWSQYFATNPIPLVFASHCGGVDRGGGGRPPAPYLPSPAPVSLLGTARAKFSSFSLPPFFPPLFSLLPPLTPLPLTLSATHCGQIFNTKKWGRCLHYPISVMQTHISVQIWFYAP